MKAFAWFSCGFISFGAMVMAMEGRFVWALCCGAFALVGGFMEYRWGSK